MNKKQRRANIRGIRETHITIKYQLLYPFFQIKHHVRRILRTYLLLNSYVTRADVILMIEAVLYINVLELNL
jgi:hypothetical protein